MMELMQRESQNIPPDMDRQQAENLYISLLDVILKSGEHNYSRLVRVNTINL